jgi:arylsulfatase A-like enzyme
MARFNDATALPVPLKRSGYRTGYFGKYFNDYSTRATYVPPGWSDWRAFNSVGPAYINYTMNENGVTVPYGTGSQNYSTNMITAHAVQFINATPPGQPFFLVYAPTAPHYPSTPDPLDVGAFSGHPAWRPLSYNEADVSDKPSWVKALPLISTTEQDSVDIEHQKQLETMLAVDRGVATMLNALSATGRLGSTVVIYTSDNGLSWGEHRWVDSKLCPYEECIRVPLWIQMPGIAGRVDDHLVQNVDLAPTIAELADVSLMTSPVNGRSLVPLLMDPSAAWRSEIFHETYSLLHPHVAVRTSQYTYVEYVNGDRELYDLVADPNQMLNVYGDPNYQAVIPDLVALLRILEAQ